MKEKFKIKYVWSFVDYSNTLLDYTGLYRINFWLFNEFTGQHVPIR